ncbi:hypothetical protein MNBD_PLANCTO02-498 [hydrothermal vent metagenome]|uniref:Uncharacterized protein n=1 Tax=hydrothermal vent metagenome TaxID=652676 RepID=A0A3B1D226_9ZZZZ
MRRRLLTFVEEQSLQAEVGEHLLGSSEVLESLIGKYKQMQKSHSKGGMTAMLLSIGSLVQEQGITTINKALEMVKTKDVDTWVKAHLGTTLQAQRNQAFSGTKPAYKTTP